jgi:hypothetical protein|tara:strand:- start:1330 stop:1443 length:114 start_codon:yes stop_codon:yes gene_type:complete
MIRNCTNISRCIETVLQELDHRAETQAAPLISEAVAS